MMNLNPSNPRRAAVEATQREARQVAAAADASVERRVFNKVVTEALATSARPHKLIHIPPNERN